jgi:hypothetical protein
MVARVALRLFFFLACTFLLLGAKQPSLLQAPPPELWHGLLGRLSPALLMAGTAALFHCLCRRRGASERLAAGLSLMLGLSTLCLCYARGSAGEAARTFALLLWYSCVLAEAARLTRSGMLALGASSGILFYSDPSYLLVLPLSVIFIASRIAAGHAAPPDRRTVAVGTLLAVLALVPFIGLSLGRPWTSAAGSPGELGPALYSYALSPGKSVFLYSPPLLLCALGAGTALRRERGQTLFTLAVLAILVLWNARYRFCLPGWGPRELVPLTPLALGLALPWLSEALARTPGALPRRALGLLFAAGMAVQLLGCCFSPQVCQRVFAAVVDRRGGTGWLAEQPAYALYVPQFSPLRSQLWLLSHWLRGTPDLGRDAPWKQLVPWPSDLRAEGQALRPDFWALGPGAAGASPGTWLLLLLQLGGLGGGAAWAAVALWRRCYKDQAEKTR